MAEPPHRVAPEGFDDAKEIADRFISGQAVVVDVGELDRETARRIIDFGSGMCYSNGGRLERIRESLYLLTPPSAEFDPPQDPDRSPLGPGGPPLPTSGAAGLPVADWVFTDAVSTKEVG